MKAKEVTVSVPSEIIQSKIYLIRGEKVMVDRDLAELYGVETKQLKRQVNRNMDRFPDDFMFEMNDEELDNWRCQFGTSNYGDKMGLRYHPYCFTEHGVLMLSSILSSQKAIQVNIQIMRIFTSIKQMLSDNTDIRQTVERLEEKTDKNTKNIELVFQYIDELSEKKENEKPRQAIGFKIPKKK
jgi:ORF6N domain